MIKGHPDAIPATDRRSARPHGDCNQNVGRLCGDHDRGRGDYVIVLSQTAVRFRRLLEFVAEAVVGHGGVAQCGVVGDAEDDRQVQRVRACGQRFVEDSVGT